MRAGWHDGRMRRRWLPLATPGWAAAVVAVLVVASGCALEDGSHLTEEAVGSPTSLAADDTTVPSEPSTTVPPDALEATYAENPCPFDEPSDVSVTCGTLTVPRDRRRPDEGTVDVAVARLAAKSSAPEPDPILYFEGGPGGASLIYADWWAEHRLLQDRDIILFDQRGTGYSSPNLSCAEEFDAASTSANDVDTYAECYERIAAETDPADFTTREAAWDVVDLMEILDLRDVDLLGVSYGTRLAMVTAELAPDRVRSVVLDSVYPPGVEALELQAGNAEGAFTELFDACAADPECDTAFPDLEAMLESAAAALDADPVEVRITDDDTGEREPTDAVGADLVDAVFSALYDRLLIPDIPRAISLANSGDPARVQDAFDLLYGESVYEAEAAAPEEPDDYAEGLYYSVTCSEEMPMTTLADVLDVAESLESDLRDELVSSAEYDARVCGVWDAGQTDAEPLEPVTSELPALLLAGTLDPITPPHWAREAAQGFAHGYVVELDGVGHGVMDSHLCGMELVREFLTNPASEPDNSCIDRSRPPPFQVD
jgi:pimeloyl-ACP methyl ester carboxylesterase